MAQSEKANDSAPSEEVCQSGHGRSLQAVILDRPDPVRRQGEIQAEAKARRGMIVELTLAGLDQEAIAKRTGLAKSTVRNILGEKRTKAAIDRGLRAASHEAIVRVSRNAGRLADRLVELATDPDVPPNVQLGAIKDGLDRIGAKVTVEADASAPVATQAVVVRFPVSGLGPAEVSVGQSVGRQGGGDEDEGDDAVDE